MPWTSCFSSTLCCCCGGSKSSPAKRVAPEFSGEFNRRLEAFHTRRTSILPQEHTPEPLVQSDAAQLARKICWSTEVHNYLAANIHFNPGQVIYFRGVQIRHVRIHNTFPFFAVYRINCDERFLDIAERFGIVPANGYTDVPVISQKLDSVYLFDDGNDENKRREKLQFLLTYGRDEKPKENFNIESYWRVIEKHKRKDRVVYEHVLQCVLVASEKKCTK